MFRKLMKVCNSFTPWLVRRVCNIVFLRFLRYSYCQSVGEYLPEGPLDCGFDSTVWSSLSVFFVIKGAFTVSASTLLFTVTLQCSGHTVKVLSYDCSLSDDVKKRFKDRLVGFFQHCNRRLIVLLPTNEFLHSSPEAPRTIQARETSASEGKNYYQGI
jgi:hypothetical protein